MGPQHGVALNYIQPGKPPQNAYLERFNRTVRYEWLSQYYWDDPGAHPAVRRAMDVAKNHERPNMGLAG
jgi:putative transposase